MSQTTLVKLIVITKSKDLNYLFWLAATSQTFVAKVTYILVLTKNISLLLHDANSLMSTCEI